MRNRGWMVLGVVVCCVVVAMAACSDDDDLGTVQGMITAADHDTPIPGVTVEVVGEESMQTRTDADGTFALDVPVGEQELSAVRGNFSALIEVDVSRNDVVELDPEPLENDAPIGYVRGAYDSIEDIIQDELGYEASEIEALDLAEVDLSEYGIIFLNCGMGFDESDEALIANLQSYVADGGIIYASDLTLPLIRAVFPENVEDSDSADAGDRAGLVTDDDLLEWFEDSDTGVEVTVTYDTGGWMTIEEITENPSVLIEGTSEDQEGNPLAIRFQPEGGSGAVVYTTFHNSQQTTEDQQILLNYFVFAE